jgi:hypothetical protein
MDPEDMEALQQKGILLGYRGVQNAVDGFLEYVLKNCPQTANTWTLLGDVERDVWVKSWREDNKTPE